MRKFLVFIFIIFGLNAYSQTYKKASVINCYACEPKSNIVTNGKINVALFDGLVIKLESGQDIIIQAPYQYTNRDSLFTFSNTFGKRITVDISESNFTNANDLKLNLRNCVCNGSGTRPEGGITLDSFSSTYPIEFDTITGNISIEKASITESGYLDSLDFQTFYNKENSISSGTTGQYFRGDKTWQSLNTQNVAETLNLYYTDQRARNSISLTTTGKGSATYNPTTGVMNIPTESNWLSEEIALPNQAAVINSVGVSFTQLGSGAGQTINQTNSSLKLKFHKRIYITAAANGIAGLRVATFANLIKTTPYGYEITKTFGFGLSPSNAKFFVGLIGSVNAPTNVEPNTLTNMFGYALNSTDTNIKLMHNDATGTATIIDTGIPRPTAEVSVYIAKFNNVGSDLKAELFIDGVSVHSATISTDIPDNNTPLTFSIWNVSSTLGTSLAFLKYVCKRNN